MKITYFVHGTTTDNEQGLATGHAPGKLSDLGIQQSKDLLSQVSDKSFKLIITSDLKRAIDSANYAWGDNNKYEIIHDKRLREADYGDLTEKPCSLFKEKMKEYVDNKFPNGESYKDVEQRIRSLLNELKISHDNEHIAFVAHEAPQLALEVITKNKTWEEAIKENWRKRGAWQPGWIYKY